MNKATNTKFIDEWNQPKQLSCPCCGKVNEFVFKDEEIKNDYDMTCDLCFRSYPISRWISQD